MDEQNKIEIFQSKDNQTKIKVQFEKETVWLTQPQLKIIYKISISIHKIYKHTLKAYSNILCVHFIYIFVMCNTNV
jgi:hypothetical protein